MIKRNFKIVLIAIFVLIAIISNILTYYISRCPKEELHDNANHIGGYRLRQDTFSNVLHVYFLPFDTSKYDIVPNRFLRAHPVIVSQEKDEIFFVDISKDSRRRGKKYYSNYCDRINPAVGDTIWIDAMIGEVPERESDKILILIDRVYFQRDYTKFRKVFFSKMK